MFRILLLAAALAGPAAAARRPSPDAQLAAMLKGRVAGAPVRCISLPGATSSRIVAGKAIVYEIGGTLYVNHPKSGAERLRDDDILVSKIFGGQLCNIDSIDLFDRTSRIPRGFVILDDFIPYTRRGTAG